MCGRFTRMMPRPELVRLYRLTEQWETQRNDPPAYNVAPTDPVPFVTARENGSQKLREGRWDVAGTLQTPSCKSLTRRACFLVSSLRRRRDMHPRTSIHRKSAGIPK